MLRKPSWTKADITGAVGAVERRLITESSYGRMLSENERRCAGASWLQKQLDIAKRSACGQAERIRTRCKNMASDAPRVLSQLLALWEGWSQRVESGPADLSEYAKHLEQGPAAFYYFLITDVANRPWWRQNPGHDASLASTYNKLSIDMKLLWTPAQFQKTFLQSYI